jgi:hypothetical protein
VTERSELSDKGFVSHEKVLQWALTINERQEHISKETEDMKNQVGILQLKVNNWNKGWPAE